MAVMGQAFAPGTWGELVQGVDERGRHFLVGLPCADGVRAVARVVSGPPSVEVPPGHLKVRRAVTLLLRRMGVCARVRLRIDSTLPRGIGRASSSADLLASLVATCRALGHPVDRPALAALCCEVEPTNPTLLPGWALFHQRCGRWLGSARPVPLRVVPVPGTGTVDTIDFHARSRPWTPAQRRAAGSNLTMLESGVLYRDPVRVARAATRSALLAAERGARPDVPRLMDLARRRRALGIAISHSGTHAALLFHPPV